MTADWYAEAGRAGQPLKGGLVIDAHTHFGHGPDFPIVRPSPEALLASMDRRARLQLRLQQTVEGLSIAAITYYVVGLVGYLAKGLKSVQVPIDPEIAIAVSIPLVASAAWLALRRARRHFERN